MLGFKAGINKTDVRIANMVDPDQTASEEEAVWSGYVLFVYVDLAGN